MCRGAVNHVYIYRDPISRRFYSANDAPSFTHLDHLVADVVGTTQIYARDTQLKLAEIEQVVVATSCRVVSCHVDGGVCVACLSFLSLFK
jgi:hypothetical protein